MVPPLLRLVATHPHLLVDHAHAYGELIGEELGKTAAGWKLRAILMATAVGLLLFGLAFAGIALMLWAAVPTNGMNLPWLLLVVPAVPLILGIGFFLYAQRPSAPAFEDLKQQWAADLQLLRETGTR